jgi:hypothetical protein
VVSARWVVRLVVGQCGGPLVRNHRGGGNHLNARIFLTRFERHDALENSQLKKLR